MTLKEFLNYSLLETKDFSVTVYEILAVVFILLVSTVIIRILKKIFRKREKNKLLDRGKGYAIFQILKYIIWVTAILASLETIGLKITLFLAGSAALLVGLGLGLQQIFQDIMSGVAILFEGTLKVDDVVEIEGGIVGKVLEIGLRTSKIETRDNIIMIIPNSKFVTDNVINWSHMEMKTRFCVDVGVAYGSDVDKVTRLLFECGNGHERVSSSPKPFVRFKNFGESSLDFQLFFWTDHTFEVENIKSDLRYRIDKAFRSNNVQIPFPQRDVHIIKAE